MKKFIALLLCLVMVVSVFAGCGPTGKPADNSGTDGSGDKTVNNDTLPDDIVLTIGLPLNGKVEDYDTNAYTLWLEDQTGYDLQFRTYQTKDADYKSQLSTQLIDNEELPDILLDFYLGSGVYNEYGMDGYFIDLTPYFEDEEKSKIWWDRFDLLDENVQGRLERGMVCVEDEAIYAFPSVQVTDYDIMNHQMWINQKWLDNLGLPMPTDIDSLYDTLVAFKTKDANGNGDPNDEIPLVGNLQSWGNVVNWIINMFVYRDISWWRVDDEGNLYDIWTSDEYREALKFINKLVKEGLMTTSVWTYNNTDLKNLMAPADGVSTVGIIGGHASLTFPVGDQTTFEYKAMPYWGYATLNDQMIDYTTFITADCEYPDAAWNLLMTMSTEESAYRQRYGDKGVDWVDADPGTKSYLGYDATMKILNEGAYTAMGNNCWHIINSTILINAENEVSQLSDDMDDWTKYRMELMKDCHDKYMEAVANSPVDEAVKTPIVYSIEEEDAIKVQRTNVQSHVNEARSSFCCGTGDKYNDPNNDKQWEAYCQEFIDLGYEDWKDMSQKLYQEQYLGK